MLNICIAVFILHLISLPIALSVEADVDSDHRTVSARVRLFGITVFKTNPNYDIITEKLNAVAAGKKSESPQKESGTSGAVKKFIISAALALLRLMRILYIGAECVFGFDDAAATAITSGTTLVALDNLCALFGCKNDINIVPDYDNNRIDIYFYCIIVLNFADIIYAVFSAVVSGFANDKIKNVKRSLYGNDIAK